MAQDTAENTGDFSTEMSGLGHGGSTITPDDHNELDALIDSSTTTTEPKKEEDNVQETKANSEVASEGDAVSSNVPDSGLQSTDSNDTTESKAEEAKEVEQPSETQASEVDPDEARLEEEFPTPKHLNQEKRASWKTLRQIAATSKKEAAEIKSKYESAVNDLVEFEKGSRLPDPVSKELKELREFRRMVDLTSDPEFVSQYDQKIIGEEDKVFAKLKDLGLADEAIQSIIQQGGILSKSKDEWGRLIFGALRGEEYEFTRAELKDSINKIFQLGGERQEELKKAAQNFDQISQKRAQERQQREAEDFTNIKGEVERIQKDIPWANEPRKPVGGTPEQMLKYQRDLQQWDQDTKRFHMYLNPPDAKTKAQAAMAAAGYFRLAEREKGYMSEIKQLKEQVARLQSVGKTVSNIAPAPKQAPKKDVLSMDDSEALESLIRESGY